MSAVPMLLPVHVPVPIVIKEDSYKERTNHRGDICLVPPAN